MNNTSTNLGHWQLAEGVTLPDNWSEEKPFGFVYRIENKETGKFYIGKKQILKVEKRPPLKGKARKRKVTKESDWKQYIGSCNSLQNDIAQLGKDKFKFEIIRFCDSKWELAYWELHYQMRNHVLFREDSYNGIINVRLAKVRGKPSHQ